MVSASCIGLSESDSMLPNMKGKNNIPAMRKISLTVVLLCGICALALAAKPDLEELMRSNGKAFSAIDKGISKGRFEGLAANARMIADTAGLVARDYEPPMHKEELVAFREMAKHLAQDAALLKAELPKANAVESKKLLKTMEKTCVSCHKMFVPKKKK